MEIWLRERAKNFDAPQDALKPAPAASRHPRTRQAPQESELQEDGRSNREEPRAAAGPEAPIPAAATSMRVWAVGTLISVAAAVIFVTTQLTPFVVQPISCEDIKRKAETVCGGLLSHDFTRSCMPYFTPTEQDVALECLRAINIEAQNTLDNLRGAVNDMREKAGLRPVR